MEPGHLINKDNPRRSEEWRRNKNDDTITTVVWKRGYMAKEEVEKTLGNPAEILADALQRIMARPSGLPVNLAGEERPIRFCNGAITNVTVGSAWIRFSRGGCTLRTREIKDRHEFWRWTLEDGQGPCTAWFYIESGSLEKSAEENLPYMPRSRYAHGRTPQRAVGVYGD